MMPAVSVQPCKYCQFTSSRKRRQNTKQLTGESENTSAPKMPWKIPCRLIWSRGVLATSVTSGPETRKLNPMIAKRMGPHLEAFPSRNSAATPHVKTKNKIPRIIKLMICIQPRGPMESSLMNVLRQS